MPRLDSVCRDAELVLAVFTNRDSAVIRLYRYGKRVLLKDLNCSRPTVFATMLTILGLVLSVIRPF